MSAKLVTSARSPIICPPRPDSHAATDSTPRVSKSRAAILAPSWGNPSVRLPLLDVPYQRTRRILAVHQRVLRSASPRVIWAYLHPTPAITESALRHNSVARG